MTIRRRVSVAVGAALLLVVGGCSDDTSSEANDTLGQATETTDAPAVTTIDLTVDGEAVELTDSVLKCYDHEGHLSVEAHNADDPDASHFLMDYYQDSVSLSIGVRDGQPDLFVYEEGTNGQTAEVTRDGDSVTVDGTIAAAGDSEPRPFTIDAQCAEFVDTPPDSSKVDPDEMPSIPGSCPPGQALCIPDGN
jgi:hypothetical protein